MNTKAKDRIRLPNGDVMTLKEALDRGIATVREDRYYDPPRYSAFVGDVGWGIGKTLFESRMGLPISAATRRGA